MAGASRLLRVVAHHGTVLVAVKHFDRGVTVQYPAGLAGLRNAVAQLRLHPLFYLQGQGLLGGAFFYAVFGLGCGRHCRQRPAQAVVTDDLGHAQHFGSDTVPTQRPDMGVAVLSSQNAQQPGAQDVSHPGCVGTAVAQGAALQPVLKQATGLQELGKEGQLAHGGSFAITAPLNLKNSTRRLHPKRLIDYLLVMLDGLLTGLAGLALCKICFTPFGVSSNHVTTRMQSTFMAIWLRLTEENRFIDEAHDLNGHTLIGLKRLMELAEDVGGRLSVILAGHSKLRNDLRRPTMEEIGYRTDIFNLDGIAGSQRDYIHWLLGVSTGNKVESESILSTDAIDILATKLRTPLQVQLHLTLALEAG